MDSFEYESILNRIKTAFENPVNQLEGSFCMDNAQAVAQELARIDSMEITPIYDRVFLDTAEGDFLDRIGIDLNEQRIQATYSKGLVTFSGVPGTVIPLGLSLYAEELEYQTTAAAAIGFDLQATVPARCMTAGVIGNRAENSIDSYTPTEGIQSLESSTAFTGGVDEESDEAYRARLLELRRKPIGSGNCNDYIRWAKQVPGVGIAKCLPCWAGAWTVKVVILDSGAKTPSGQLIQQVQAHIDANRPPCAVITVVAATPIKLSVAAQLVLAPGYSLTDIRASVTAKLQDYITQLAFDSRNTFSYFKAGDVIFSVDGVADIITYTINGAAESIKACAEEFFQLQEVVIDGD